MVFNDAGGRLVRAGQKVLTTFAAIFGGGATGTMLANQYLRGSPDNVILKTEKSGSWLKFNEFKNKNFKKLESDNQKLQSIKKPNSKTAALLRDNIALRNKIDYFMIKSSRTYGIQKGIISGR